MHPHEEPQLTIPKLPFYIGDGLLVATALAIAVLAGWQLSDLQVAYCVVAVALGAALTCLPFIVEYFMRSKEQSEDRIAEIALLKKQLAQAADVFDQFAARQDELESRLSANAESGGAVVRGLDQRLAEVDQLRDQVRATRSHLESRLEELTQAQPDPAVAELLTGLEQSIAELKGGQAAAQQEHVDLESLMGTVRGIQNLLDQHSDQLNKLESARQDVAPQRTVRGRAGKKGLLHRAIHEKQDLSAKAVKRIIRARPIELQGGVEATEDVDSVLAEATPVGAAAEQNKDANVSEVELEGPRSESEPEPVDVMMEDSGASTTASEYEATEVQAADSETQVESTEAPATVVGDLFGETAAAPAPKRKIRSRKHDAVLTVSILIGIGNKPFLRGSAAGLSWEQGLEMDFQEIGKWRWVAPDDLEEPIEVQVYRNDEDPDLSGSYRLEPGQKLEIKPSF